MSSLAALKASSKKTLAQELKTPEPETPAVEEAPATEETTETAEAGEGEVNIDVDAMTAKQLDEFVASYQIETPAEWKKWKKAEKADWLKATFGADEEGEAAAEATEEAPTEEAPAPEAEAPAAEPAKPAKAAAKKSGKTVATQNILHGEVITADEFTITVSEIENLKPKDALELVDKLADQSELTLFKLGGVLSRIQSDGWFKDQGFSTFREYIETRHAFGYRKAMYQIAIYNALVESGVAFSDVAGVKWSKLKEIASVINPENVAEWVKLANENTIDNLIKLVSNVKKGGSEEAAGQLSAPAEGIITTMAFKVHTDQKENIQMALDKAKAEAKTDVNTVALEYICIAFNSNAATNKGNKAKVVPAKEQLAEMGLEAAAQLLIDTFPEYSIDIAVGGTDAEE